MVNCLRALSALKRTGPSSYTDALKRMLAAALKWTKSTGKKMDARYSEAWAMVRPERIKLAAVLAAEKARPLGVLDRGKLCVPAGRYHQGRQRSGTTHPGRGGMELSVPCTRGTGEAAKGRSRAEARPGDRVESANATVRPLPCAPAQRQAADGRCYGDCPRAISLHLGDQSRGHGNSASVTSSRAVDRSSRGGARPAHSPTLRSRDKYS